MPQLPRLWQGKWQNKKTAFGPFFCNVLADRQSYGCREVRNLEPFEEIYERYFKDVYRYALSLTRDEAEAEEITQETFFKALRSIDRFDGRCRLYVWLCQIAKHTYFSLREKQGRTAAMAEIPDSGSGLEEGLLQKDTAFRIHQVLHRLDEPYKEVFSLRTFGELPFKQIGMLFGKTESWARVTYHRARLKIREELE